MAADFQSIGADDYITSGTTLSPGAPSGVVSGDVLLLFLNIELGGAPTTPTGWTSIGSQDYWFSTGVIYAYWREADETSSDTPSVTLASAPTSGRAVLVRFDGVDTTSPIDVSSFTEDKSSPITHSDVTASSADSLAVVFGGSYLSETGTYTFGNSFTERLGTTSNEAMWVGTKSVSSGAVGTTDVTNTTTLIRSGALTLVLSPSTGGGSITTSGIATSEAIGTATITTGGVSISPTGISSAEALGSATLSSIYNLSPSSISSAEAIGSHALSVGAVIVQPASLSSSEAFGSATVTTNAVVLSPSGISSAEALGDAVFSLGPVTILPSGITTAEAIGSAVVNSGILVLPASISSLEALGSPVLSVGIVTLLPVGIASNEQIGAAIIGDIIIVGEIAFVRDIVSDLCTDIGENIYG